MPEDPKPTLVPAKAVDVDGADLGKPTVEYLRALGLLPLKGETADGWRAVLGGTPDSVSVIEAGATSLSKWWAAGLGTALAAGWGSARVWFPSQESGIQETVIWAAAVASAAVAVGIAYIVGSDVRGRSAASVAMLNARSAVAGAMLREAVGVYKPAPPEPAGQVFPVSPHLELEWTKRDKDDEPGWIATAMRITGDKVEYWLAKERVHGWAPADEVRFT
jgi:hypothetical protein